MTRTTESATYRQEQPAPTEPGLYWAQFYDRGITVVRVRTTLVGELAVQQLGEEGYWTLGLFRWFGPVTPCKEG